MKASKIILPIILVAALLLAWYVNLSGAEKNKKDYKDCINLAEESIENGLYEQAVEFYKDSLRYKNSKNIFLKIRDVYELFYNEEHTTFVRNCYIEDMELAAEKYPKCAEFWVTTANLYLEALNYSSAYKTVQRGLNYGASSKELDALYTKLLYMVKTDYKLYYDFKTALNGYISVYDGNRWTVLDGSGEPVTSSYNFIGLINDSGKGFYKNDIDTRFLDENEIARARFSFNIEDAGYYDEKSGYAPVKIDGKWKYVNLEGEFLSGEYDMAGSFYNHRAAVKNDGKWFLIDESGNKCSDKTYEDIKLDLYGSYIQSDIIIAKENGSYHLYNNSFNQIGDFSCDDIDICMNGNLIAFEKDGKWGYVNSKGKIVLEPKYMKAKSFSSKMAAVVDESGMWGFINSDYEMVIEGQFLEAFYFNSDETCIVSTTENTYQILHFMFN